MKQLAAALLRCQRSELSLFCPDSQVDHLFTFWLHGTWVCKGVCAHAQVFYGNIWIWHDKKVYEAVCIPDGRGTQTQSLLEKKNIWVFHLKSGFLLNSLLNSLWWLCSFGELDFAQCFSQLFFKQTVTESKYFFFFSKSKSMQRKEKVSILRICLPKGMTNNHLGNVRKYMIYTL